MLPGPMFSLEMVTSARRTRYFIVRVVYAVVLFLCLLMIYNDHTSSRQEMSVAMVAQMSYIFFTTFSFLQLLLVVGLGPAMAAGTIASERERKTIEHLFVTQLSNAEIVLGKLLARLIQIAYLVLVGLPILALAMLMGGIAPEALLMLFLITLSTMLTVSILSITVSVWSARSREAVVRAYLLVFVWLVIPPLFAVSSRFMFLSPIVDEINEQLLATNPFWVFSSILTWASGVQVRDAWGLLGVMARNQGIICLAGVMASTWAVRRVHLKDRSKGEKKRLRRLQWLRPAVGNQPMLWKELFAEPAASKLGRLGYLLMGIIVIAILGITAYAFHYNVYENHYRPYGNRPEYAGYLTYTSFITTILTSGCLLLLAARSASAITSEKERDCWVSLLSTPLTPAEIVWGKVAGNLYFLRWACFLLVILWGLALMLDPLFLGSVLLQGFTFLSLSFFVSSLGVLYSLWCKTSLKAMAATLATLIFFGGGYTFCCLVMLIGSRGPGNEMEFILTGVIPFLLLYPGMIYAEPHAPDRIHAAFIIGLLFYSIIGPSLFSCAIANFESMVGRAGADPQPRRRPKWDSVPSQAAKLSQNVIVAEAVEE